MVDIGEDCSLDFWEVVSKVATDYEVNRIKEMFQTAMKSMEQI